MNHLNSNEDITTFYFGLAINNENILDARNVAARLFICPRIAPEHASKILDMLTDCTLPLHKFIARTDEYLADLNKKKESEEDITNIMKNKLQAWTKTFSSPSEDDYDYLKKEFGFTKEYLFGHSKSAVKTPREMAEYVKQYVKGQDAAVEKLAVPFFQHLDSKRKHYTCKIKTPVVMLGPTGAGKSEILRVMGGLCDCPVIRINSSEVVPTAWKGLHISDILAREINDEVTVTDLEYAIIVFHEFDKITHYGQKLASSSGSDMDQDMMRDIMKFFETGYSIYLENGIVPESMTTRSYKLPVDNLLIVFDGAFYGMEDIIKKRLGMSKNIGFTNSQNTETRNINIQESICNEDLLEWGFIPELIGRIGNIAALNPLSEDTIYEIMTTAKDNILQSHIDYCSQNNVKLQFSDDALHFIARGAYKSGLGFRNVKTILSKILNPIYYDFPGTPDEESRKVVEINKDIVLRNISDKVADK